MNHPQFGTFVIPNTVVKYRTVWYNTKHMASLDLTYENNNESKQYWDEMKVQNRLPYIPLSHPAMQVQNLLMM